MKKTKRPKTILTRTILTTSSLIKTTLLISITCILISRIAYSDTADMEDLEKQIKEAQQQYEALEALVHKNDKASKRALRKLNKLDLQIRGFFSIGVATTDGNAKLRKLNTLEEIGDEPNFQTDMITGLQFDATINHKTRYTHQLTTVGYDIDHTVKTEWAYFSYQFSADSALQAGRLRIPFYFLSESLDVGFTYPWARPPLEIYSIPLTGYEGANFSQNFTFQEGYGRASVFFGSGFTDVSALLNADLAFTDIKGISLDFSLHNWSFRASYITANGSFEGNVSCDVDSVNSAISAVITSGAPFDPKEIDCGGIDTFTVAFAEVDKSITSEELKVSHLYTPDDWTLKYIDLAVKYERGAMLLMAEYGESRVTQYFNPLGPAFSVLYGHRFGNWLPYIAFVKFETSDQTKNLVNEISNRVSLGFNNPNIGAIMRELLEDAGTIVTSRSYTLGINYWINENLRGKFEIAHYEDFKGTLGNFVSDPGSHNAVYSLVIDGVF